MGYLPRSAFFIAIKMGSVILMILSQEIRVEAKESIKKQIRNTFKSNSLPMKRNLVREQVLKTQSNKHRKATQVQLQDSQHKEGKLNIIKMHITMFPSLIITFSSIMNKLNNITIIYNILVMSHMHKIITLHISIINFISCSGSKFNKVAIIIILIKCRRHSIIKIKFTLHSRRHQKTTIIIIIINRRQSIIKENFLLNAWGTKNIMLIKTSFPKLRIFHIISNNGVQSVHTNMIATSMEIRFHRFFNFRSKQSMS